MRVCQDRCGGRESREESRAPVLCAGALFNPVSKPPHSKDAWLPHSTAHHTTAQHTTPQHATACTNARQKSQNHNCSPATISSRCRHNRSVLTSRLIACSPTRAVTDTSQRRRRNLQLHPLPQPGGSSHMPYTKRTVTIRPHQRCICC